MTYKLLDDEPVPAGPRSKKGCTSLEDAPNPYLGQPLSAKHPCAMEQTFERRAAVAEGRPALRESLPDRTDFAAALLILREFMHHLRFASITLP